MTTPDLEARLAVIRKAITDLNTARAAIIGTLPTEGQIVDAARNTGVGAANSGVIARSYTTRTDVAWARMGEAIDQLKFAAERVTILLDQANDRADLGV